MYYENVQMNEARDWFLANYTDPADCIPHDKKEGGYQFSGNGPFDALEVLRQEFEGKIPDDMIRKVAEDLTAECGEWVAIPNCQD